MAIIVPLAVGALAPAVMAGEPFRFPEGRHGTGELKYVNGLPVLTVSGTPEQIGEAVGVLAVRPAAKMASYPEELLANFWLHPLWPMLVQAGERMARLFPPDFRRELEAMIRASGVGRQKLVAGNTLFDLKKLVACSALLVEARRSETGAPLLGRNLDYPSLGYAHEYSLVTVCRPRGAKHAFASVGFPGLVGCLSGINDAGLSLAILEVYQVRVPLAWFNASGTPYALCYRRLLEECSTIAEAKVLLESMKRTTTTNLVLADRGGIAVFEVTPDRVVVRRAENGTCVCTNHYCMDPLRPRLPIDYFQTYERFQILKRDAGCRETLGLADLHRSLHAVCVSDETLQTMIFEPATLRLHLAIGTCPSSAAAMKTLDLRPLLLPATTR
jgi:hypothetical protein